MRRLLFLIQGFFYAVTGIWPLLHRRSFEAVTGPKSDFWLVRTVGTLVTVIGTALAFAGARGRSGPETRLLAMGSALGFAAVDLNYALRGRISRIYLLDAAAEASLLLLWAVSELRGPAGARSEVQAPSSRPAAAVH